MQPSLMGVESFRVGFEPEPLTACTNGYRNCPLKWQNVVIMTTAEEVGFEPTDPCRSHDFQSHRGRLTPSGVVHSRSSGGVSPPVGSESIRRESSGLVVSLVVKPLRLGFDSESATGPA